MRLVYRALALLVGIAAIVGGLAALVIPYRVHNRIKKNPIPVTGIVDSIDPPYQQNREPYTMQVHFNAPSGDYNSIQVRTNEFHNQGSEVNVLVDPNHPTEGIVKGELPLYAIVWGLIALGLGIGMIVLSFSKKLPDKINQKLAQQPSMIKNLDTDSKWANAAFMMSLFNIVLLPAPITAPLSIILGIIALFDMKKNHKTGKSKLIFTFVYSGLFVLGFAVLIIANN